MEKLICEKCGNEMENLSEGPYIIVKCPRCGWNWTAYDSEKSTDDSISCSVTFEGGQYTKERALVLAQMIPGNAVLSKRLLEEGGTVIIDSFREKEPELKELGIKFVATPK